jgi:hypothetical protein
LIISRFTLLTKWFLRLRIAESGVLPSPVQSFDTFVVFRHD